MKSQARNRERRGVALLLVLWLVVILASVTIAASSAARSSGDLVTARRASATAQSMAESGITAAVALIDDSLRALVADTVARDAFLNALDAGVNNGATAIGRAGSDTLVDGAFAVAVVDVAARLDVNNSGEASLEKFFGGFTNANDARLLARRIAERVRGEGLPNDSTSVARLERDSTVRALLGQSNVTTLLRHPFESLDQLAEIPGLDAKLLATAAPLLTVDGEATVNKHSAPAVVVAAASGTVTEAPTRLLLISRGWQIGHPLTARNSSGVRHHDQWTGAGALAGARVVMAPIVGVALEVSVVRAAYRNGGRVVLVEHAWDSLAPERVVDALRAEIGTAQSIVLSVGLGFLEVAKPELPSMADGDRRRVLLRDADRYFPLDGALAIASAHSGGLAFATTSDQLQRWVRAFEEWAPVRGVISAPDAIAAVVSSSGTFVIDAGADEQGVLQLTSGEVREARRVPLHASAAATNGATSLLATGTDASPGKHSAALGALQFADAPLEAMLLDAPLENALRSSRVRRSWISYAVAAIAFVALAFAANSRPRRNSARDSACGGFLADAGRTGTRDQGADYATQAGSHHSCVTRTVAERSASRSCDDQSIAAC